MLLADYAVVSDGKLTIVGGGWSQTGPEPAAFGIGLLIQVPWDQREHACTRSPWSCSTRTEAPSPSRQTRTTITRWRSGASSRSGDRPGSSPELRSTSRWRSTRLRLPLEPGRYEWRLTIDGDSREDWTLPFTVRSEEP